MKKLIFIALAIIMCNTTAHAVKTVNVTKCHPSPAGTYKDVNDSYNPTYNTYYLYCEDPGNVTCAWVNYHPLTQGQQTNIDNGVSEQIVGGQMSGTAEIEGETVTWNATSETCYTFTLEISEE